MIFVSSVALKNPSLKDLKKLSEELNINIELNGNISYLENVDEVLQSFPNQVLIHNYFPKPENDFVINLASKDEEIRKKSIEFACQNIFRCEKFNIRSEERRV